MVCSVIFSQKMMLVTWMAGESEKMAVWHIYIFFVSVTFFWPLTFVEPLCMCKSCRCSFPFMHYLSTCIKWMHNGEFASPCLAARFFKLLHQFSLNFSKLVHYTKTSEIFETICWCGKYSSHAGQKYFETKKHICSTVNLITINSCLQ
jgi:hypothetical protein